MHEVLENRFPYSLPDYDSRFLNQRAIEHIRNNCESNPHIKAFYAKGSIIHDCMIKGSDIDQVRIHTHQNLGIHQKIEFKG